MSASEVVLILSLILSAYLLGSVSSAILVCRLMGLADPRDSGSHNPGTTNVMRIGGRKAALFTLIGDVAKGVLPVLIAKYLDFSVIWLSAVIAAAFIGHCLPLFFNFNGGKGIATAFGAITTMHWQIGLLLLLIWVIVFFIFRISSLAGISAALTLPMASWFLYPESFLSLTVLALLVVWRHHENISKLISGEEDVFRKG